MPKVQYTVYWSSVRLLSGLVQLCCSAAIVKHLREFQQDCIAICFSGNDWDIDIYLFMKLNTVIFSLLFVGGTVFFFSSLKVKVCTVVEVSTL